MKTEFQAQLSRKRFKFNVLTACKDVGIGSDGLIVLLVKQMQKGAGIFFIAKDN